MPGDNEGPLCGPGQGDVDHSLANYDEVVETIQKAGKSVARTRKEPRRSVEILADLQTRTGGWPKVVCGALFAEGPDHQPRYLKTPACLFAWIDKLARVDWQKGAAFVTQERFFEFIRAEAENFTTIETVPHCPPLPGAYYMHPPLPEADGKSLATLLQFFQPATELDRSLLLAAIVTPYWGGKPGSSPGFLLTGASDDAEQGRGLGKTTFIDVIATELYGGSLDAQPSSDMETIKTRLLSPGATTLRIARLDNVKTHRFSWGELEGLMTAGIISGRRLYDGEGRRPNTLTWFITINGASLSKDLARRLVSVHLARPDYKVGWEAELLAHVRGNRWKILADIGAFLVRPAPPLQVRLKWGPWEQAVLAPMDDPAGCQALILERQGEMDDDEHDRDLVLDYFRDQLVTRLRLGPGQTVDTVRAFIPSKLAGEWLSELMHHTYATNRATPYLRTLCLRELQYKPSSSKPGFIWRGADWKGREEDRLHPVE